MQAIFQANTDANGLTYGITALDQNGNLLKEIKDISTDEKLIAELVARCNKGKLSITHFEDVIEDFLTVYY